MGAAKVSGKYIFCRTPGVTKEHIWPQWLIGFLPKEAYSSGHIHGTGVFDYSGNEQRQIGYRYKTGTGNIHSRRLKIVCRTCNNIWMSRLQERVKSILLPLIKSESNADKLSDSSRRLLSAWAIMFTMVLEFAHPPTVALTAEERKNFSYSQEPNDRWMIWIGRGELTIWKFFHFAWMAQDASLPITEAPKPNSQVTTFRVGDLILHTYYTRDPLIRLNSTAFALRHKMIPLWP